MANLRQIRTRIRSVQNTQKITRAMQMVAGAKLRRAQEALWQARPYVDRLEAMTRRFLEAAPAVTHPLLGPGGTAPFGDSPSPVETPMALVVVTSDTGLCGSYNERLLTMARRLLAETPARLVPIGRKGVAAARRQGWPILASYTELGGKVTDAFVHTLATRLIEAYQGGEVRGVQILYTAFKSALSWRPTVASWLPLIPPGAQEALVEPVIFEPSPAAIAAELLPATLTATLRRLLLEGMTSEHSARMVAMKAATDNAAEMIESLTLVRNKVRQAAITKEISEIVAGVEALKA